MAGRVLYAIRYCLERAAQLKQALVSQLQCLEVIIILSPIQIVRRRRRSLEVSAKVSKIQPIITIDVTIVLLYHYEELL